jgi:predicted nucleic acid-binding protein
MIIVCDCSPLIALALCDQLALLDVIFIEVVVNIRIADGLYESVLKQAKE